MSADPKRVQLLFLAATALPAADRKAFLDDECADPELRRRVDALLAAHDEPDSFLTQPALAPIADTGTFAEPELAPTVPHLDQPDRVGEVIAGRYKLLEPIGEGGMGSVWMAEQREPVRRLVAIKLIKAGMDSKTVLARFEAERQALAMMDHPNIAKVLDGGTTSDSRPYFVMELVKGVPITKYCDAAKLTPRERLELFVPVCQAIQHAHQKGIIHRDIKPTNVLIALYDGKPVPKVIDFGIAKATGQALTDRTLHTGFGAVVGTPEYMAPEQAEFNQLDVDTRSDIYSLGVLLYELLTGSTPFDRTRLGKAAILEILRIVREEEPPKPSTKLSTAGALASIAANRRTEPRKLTAIIKGELDWIVMKCLEKDRGRRYDTANGLAADVQRYLADEPVQARAPSAGYRLRKFLRRNRVVVVVAGIIWLVTLMQVGFSTLQWLKASDERDVAQRERETANQERMEANQARQVAVAAGVEARNAQQAAQEAQHQEFLARQQAEQDRDAKNAALLRSDGLRLGSEASLIRTANPALSLLLGLEAVKRYPHPLTYTALYSAATELREVRTIHNDGVTINLLRLSDDGSRLLTAHHDGGSQTASVYDVASGKRVGGWHGFSHRLGDVNWSPDGKRAVAATSGRAMVTYTDGRKPERATFTERVAYVWDIETGKDMLHLKGHADKVVSARYSPDGTKILTASWDRTARLWDAKTGKELHVLRGHKQALLGATMSADGRWVVTVSAHHNNTAGYLDNKGQPRPEPRTEDGELDPGVTDRPFQSNGHSSGYSGSGFMEDEQPFARVWDAATGKQVAVLEIKRGSFDFLSSSLRWRQSPTYAAFSPDGKRIALGFEDGTVRLWDTETGGATPITLTGHKQRVLTMAFRADGKRLITAGSEDAMIVWNLETNRGERWLRGHQATSIHTVRYSADGSKILSAAADKTVRVWDADAEVGNERAVYRGHASQIAGAEFLPDGNTIVSAGDGVRFWSIAPPAPVAVELRAKAPVTGLGQFFGADRSEHSAEVTALAFSPDGTRIVTGSQDRTVRLWDVATGHHLKGVSEQQVRGQVQSVAFTPDGKTVYFGSALNVLTMQRPTDKETALSLVHRWDLETNRATRHLKNFSRVATHLTLSRDGKRLLVVAGSDGLQFNQEGYVTWGYSSNRFPNAASTWDAATGTPLAAIEGQRGRSDGPPPQLSPDGKLILLAEANEQGSKVSLALFDAETGKRVRTLADLPPHGGSSNRWTTFVFSPDGQTIAAQHPGRPFVWFWSATTGERLGSFESKASSQSWNAQRLVFSPDSKRIATTIDRTVVLVDVATRTELRQLRGHEERITSLAFAPDGSRLLTGSEDGSAILWDVVTGVIQTVYKGHAGPVKHVAYSPDGTRVATASTEPYARVWAVNLLPEFERRKPRELTTVERQRYELSEQSRK